MTPKDATRAKKPHLVYVRGQAQNAQIAQCLGYALRGGINARAVYSDNTGGASIGPQLAAAIDAIKERRFAGIIVDKDQTIARYEPSFVRVRDALEGAALHIVKPKTLSIEETLQRVQAILSDRTMYGELVKRAGFRASRDPRAEGAERIFLDVCQRFEATIASMLDPDPRRRKRALAHPLFSGILGRPLASAPSRRARNRRALSLLFPGLSQSTLDAVMNKIMTSDTAEKLGDLSGVAWSLANISGWLDNEGRELSV